MKQTGILVGNFEFNPYTRPSGAWLKVFMTPKGDQSGHERSLKNKQIRHAMSFNDIKT